MKARLINITLVFLTLLISSQIIFAKKSKKATLPELIASAQKIYFLPLTQKPLVSTLTVEQEKEKPKSDSPAPSGPTKTLFKTTETLLTLDEIKDINTKSFDKVKTLIGDKLAMVPDKFIKTKKSFGAEITKYDLKGMDCDIYIQVIMEIPAAKRDVSYKVIASDVRTKKLLKPMKFDITLKIMHKNKKGKKGKKVYKETAYLAGIVNVEMTGDVNNESIAKAMAKTATDEEKPIQSKSETDNFTWLPEYYGDNETVKYTVVSFVSGLREKVTTRLAVWYTAFEKPLSDGVSSK